jgi:hypothetical protein
MSELSRFNSQIAEGIARVQGALSQVEADRELLQAELQNTSQALLGELRKRPRLVLKAVENDGPLISWLLLIDFLNLSEISAVFIDAVIDLPGIPAAGAAILANLKGAMLARQGNYAGAERDIRRSQSEFAELAELREEFLGTTTANLASLALHIGDVPTAEGLLRDYVNRYMSHSSSVVKFLAASTVFESSRLSSNLPRSRKALFALERASLSVAEELEPRDPYLGLVLITVASAKCDQAAAEGQLSELSAASHVLAIAVQRISGQLGSHHPYTFNAMANLATAEFESALLSSSSDAMLKGLKGLKVLRDQSMSFLGLGHPQTVILFGNSAVAELEYAREVKSIPRLRDSVSNLNDAVILGEAHSVVLIPGL